VSAWRTWLHGFLHTFKLILEPRFVNTLFERHRFESVWRLLRDASCATLDESDCTTAGGFYLGDGSTCGLDSCPDMTPFVGGDCSGDGELGIVDPMTLLFALFGTTGMPGCLEACDANGDGATDITDAVFGLLCLFLNGAEPLAPFPTLGSDLDIGNSLGCGDSGYP
jgi:hypothetical protein